MMRILCDLLSAEKMQKSAPTTNRTRIKVSLRDEEHAALATLAERHDVSLSWLTRQAVAEFLARQKVDNPRPGLDLPLRAAADE